MHLDNLIDYMNLADQEVLIQTAIMHAQFEIIHPFSDGNGRTGRILIPLFLWCKERISSPMFYISEYFDENRDQYVENLRRISDAKDWEHWILFFLEAITVQAKRNSEKGDSGCKFIQHNAFRRSLNSPNRLMRWKYWMPSSFHLS